MEDKDIIMELVCTNCDNDLLQLSLYGLRCHECGTSMAYKDERKIKKIEAK